MYEHRTKPVLPRRDFLRRAAGHLLLGVVIVLASVFAGTLGYHVFVGLPWIDAFLNASMILGGMGPLAPVVTPAAKLFAAFYALYSGLFFVAFIGVVLAPWVHRLLHKMHVEP
jgi:hypothetical protein